SFAAAARRPGIRAGALGPVPRSLDGLPPARVKAGPLGLRHPRFPALAVAPVSAQRADVRPKAYREPRGVCGAERRRLEDLGPRDRHAEDVGLKLHQKVILDHAAIDA